MCNFCEVLLNEDKDKELIWNVRSTMADDNIHEFMEEINGYNTIEDYSWFSLNGYNYEGNILVSVDYRQELILNNNNKVLIQPFSETVQFNYCPICGKQISKNIKELSDSYNYGISIVSKEEI